MNNQSESEKFYHALNSTADTTVTMVGWIVRLMILSAVATAIGVAATGIDWMTQGDEFTPYIGMTVGTGTFLIFGIMSVFALKPRHRSTAWFVLAFTVVPLLVIASTLLDHFS